MIVVGAVLRSGRMADFRVVQMLRQIDFGGVNVGDAMTALSALVIVVGVFTLILSATGGFGACFRKKWMLILVSYLRNGLITGIILKLSS